MIDRYPEHTWTSTDSEKLSDAYKRMDHDIKCPACEGVVKTEKQEGPEHVKKEYVKTTFFVVFTCTNCGRTDTKTYRRR